MFRRYMLRATPVPEDTLSDVMCRDFNRKPEWFWTRWGAERAVHFYEKVLEMPVRFWIIDRRDMRVVSQRETAS